MPCTRSAKNVVAEYTQHCFYRMDTRALSLLQRDTDRLLYSGSAVSGIHIRGWTEAGERNGSLIAGAEGF